MSDLTIEVFDKHGNFCGPVGRIHNATLLDVFNGKSSSQFTIDANAPRAGDLMAEGAMVRYETEGLVQTAWVNTWQSEGPRSSPQVSFTTDSHFMLFEDVLGWVVPTGDIDEQGTAGTNYTLTDDEETVVKTVMAANARDRLGLPLTVATNLGRGPERKLKMRFQPIFDKLFPTQDGLGLENSTLRWTIVFNPSTKRYVLDCTPVATFPRTLTERNGIIAWRVTRARPAATRVVIGGAGEAQMRDFRYMVDEDRETLYGQIRERFRDARDADGDPEVMYSRGQETLDEGRAKAGISITLAQSAGIRYGKTMKVGDRVTLDVGTGVPIGPEILRSVRINFSRDKGREVTPVIGDEGSQESQEKKLVNLVGRIARALRKDVS